MEITEFIAIGCFVLASFLCFADAFGFVPQPPEWKPRNGRRALLLAVPGAMWATVAVTIVVAQEAYRITGIIGALAAIFMVAITGSSYRNDEWTSPREDRRAAREQSGTDSTA